MHKAPTLLFPTFLFGMSSLMAAEEAKPAFTLSSNAYLVSDYLFRGQTQTWGRPAVQAGFDFAHESGLYLGTWASNVSGNQFAGGSLELALYGGYSSKISEGVGYSAGLLYYYYPGANYGKIYSCPVAHVGYTGFSEERSAPINGETDPSFFDWKLGVSYAFKDGWSVGAYYVDATNKDFWKDSASAANADLKDLNRSTIYITAGRTF